MNTDKETKKRLKLKLYNALKEIDGLAEFIQVHNEDDESAAYRRGCEMQDEVKHMATRLESIFNNYKGI
jgi:hypothetical protein